MRNSPSTAEAELAADRTEPSRQNTAFSIVVMAHPTRRDSAEMIADRVNATVVYDPDPDGPADSLRCAAEAWASSSDDVTHHVVLQDDVLPCSDFPILLKEAIDSRPHDALSLFGFASSGASATSRISALLGIPWFRSREYFLAAPALVFPKTVADGASEHLRKVIARRSMGSDPRHSFRDALQLRKYLHDRGTRAYTSVVSLVEHDVLGKPSLMGGSEKGLRRASCFRNDVDGAVTFDSRALEIPRARPHTSYEDVRTHVETYKEDGEWHSQRADVWCAEAGISLNSVLEGMPSAFDELGRDDAAWLRHHLRGPVLGEFWTTSVLIGHTAALHGWNDDKVLPAARRALGTIAPGALNRILSNEMLEELANRSADLAARGALVGQHLARSTDPDTRCDDQTHVDTPCQRIP